MKVVSLCGLAVALALCAAAASARQPITTPILPTDKNFRDLAGIAKRYGGTGFVNTTSHHGVMRTNVFYRSGGLSGLDDTDWAILSSLRNELVVDLRTPSEIAQYPDRVPAGATWTNVNIYGTDAPPPVPTMEAQYCLFVTSEVERAALNEVLLDLANTSGPVLFHCKSGKDRTGWTAMLLQSIAGVSSPTIMQDYLASNAYLDRPDAVREGWLLAGLDELTHTFGSMDAYLKEGLGLTQADIYVLRAKMVYYQTLPGQGGFSGNAAAGATFLKELQDSPLSGSYTAFNYYLQSAIDAGSLGGVETRVGGQVHADAVSYLLRQPLWVDWAVAPYAAGSDLCVGQERVWVAGLGNYFRCNAPAGLANSADGNGGALVGITFRVTEQASAFLAVGDNAGSVTASDANSSVNTGLAVLGGRYGFFGLESGPYLAARADIGWVDDTSTRALGGGLGTARGHTNGNLYSGRLDFGTVVRLDSLAITPHTGIRVANAYLGSFNESDNELALGMAGITHTLPSFLADVDVSLDPRRWHGWIVVPSLDLGCEVALSNPQVQSTGNLYGFTVNQWSAYDSWYLMKIGTSVAAHRNDFMLTCGINTVLGEGVSTGLIPQLSIGYRF